MSYGILPNGKQQFIDSNGNPLAGGKVYYYIPSTTTFKNTYQDDAGVNLNTNPIVLDANGQCIAYGQGSYRQQVKDVNNNLIWDVQIDAPATQTDLNNFESSLASSTGSSLIGYNEGVTGAITTTVQAKLRQTVSVMDFGATGNGTTDDTNNIQLALNTGADVWFPNGTYAISNSLIVKSNSTVYFDGQIKVTAMPTGGYESAFVTDPSGAVNVTFFNPQIDLNSIVPASGILIRYADTNVRVIGGYIRNGLNSVTYSGGRGINIEGGATPSNITISGTNIVNCWEGISLSGGTGQEAANISIGNLTISNCQSAIGLSGNAGSYPLDGSYMQAVFSNISIRNCGVVTTYSRQAGVINSDRGSNVMFNNIYIYNSASYGTPDSLWRGDANNIKMTNVTMEGDVAGSMFNFASYQEANSFPLATYSSLDSDFKNITMKGTCPIIISLPITTASYLTNTRFDLITNTVTSGSPTTTALNNKTDVYMRVQNKTSNAIIEGYAADINSGTTFAQWANQEGNLTITGIAKSYANFVGSTGTVNNGSNISVSRSSAGSYSITFTRTLPATSYTVLVMVEPTSITNYNAFVVSSKAASGFNLGTFLGSTLTDFPNVNVVVYY